MRRGRFPGSPGINQLDLPPLWRALGLIQGLGVTIEAKPKQLQAHLRDEKLLRFMRCATCGCVVCWLPADPEHNRMGVNTRMFDPAAMQGVRCELRDAGVVIELIDQSPADCADWAAQRATAAASSMKGLAKA